MLVTDRPSDLRTEVGDRGWVGLLRSLLMKLIGVTRCTSIGEAGEAGAYASRSCGGAVTKDIAPRWWMEWPFRLSGLYGSLRRCGRG